MVETILRRGKSKTREQRENQENNERVGKSESEARHSVVSKISLLGIIMLEMSDRSAQYHENTKDNENQTTTYLEQVLVLSDKIGNER